MNEELRRNWRHDEAYYNIGIQSRRSAFGHGVAMEHELKKKIEFATTL